MKNRVVRISIDVDVNVNVDFENLEENVYNLLSQLGIVEAVVTSDEEVDDNRMLTIDEANAALKNMFLKDETYLYAETGMLDDNEEDKSTNMSKEEKLEEWDIDP